jgi:curved DNA-binding protein CbpA
MFSIKSTQLLPPTAFQPRTCEVAMESEPTNEVPPEVPLTTLYLQIEYNDYPTAVLGIGTGASEVEIRIAYRALALRIHPDKAPSEGLRALHTLLFQKIQTAFNSLLETPDDEAGQDSRPKQLPESWASLHARNVAFREALRDARDKAVQAKHGADRLKASKAANLKAKNERLAKERELRAHTLKEEQAKRQTEIAKEKRKFGKKGGAKVSSKNLSDQKKMVNDLEAKDASQFDESQKPQRLPYNSQLKRPLQNKPTARTAIATWDPALDERLVSDAEIEARWNKNLLSGGRSGSVSLSRKKQREHNAAARMHKDNMALCDEADRLLKPALTGNRTFSFSEYEGLLKAAFVRTEQRAQDRTDRFLRVTLGDVTEQFLLQDGQELPQQSLSLASLAIEAKK